MNVFMYDKKIIAGYKLESYPNYAQDKIKMYYKDDIFEPYTALQENKYDMIYASSIFTFTDKSMVPPQAICGGTGFDIKNKLPAEIESMRPRQNYGFCTRGCNNKCPWCVVPQKEGRTKPYADVYEIWDGKAKEIKLWDNNILQLPDYFKIICEQLYKENLKVDFNQGLDIRLLTSDVIKQLKKLSHAEYHFAFDASKLDNIVVQKVDLLKKSGINRSTFYVLAGFPRNRTTVREDIEDVLYRLNLLKSLGQNACVMRYKKIYSSQPDSLINKRTRKFYIAIANWANVHQAFQKMDFLKDYISKHKRGSPYKPYFRELGLTK